MVQTFKSPTSTPEATPSNPEPEITSSVKPNPNIQEYTSGLDVQDLVEQWNKIQKYNMIAPPDTIHDPFRAMGMALFHMGSATLQYGLVATGFPIRKFGDSMEQLVERYLWAESEARSAQVLIYRAIDLGYEDKEFRLGGEIKKSCRKAKIWLTQERQEAAIKLGIDPPPMIDEDVQTDQLDYDYDPEDRAPE